MSESPDDRGLRASLRSTPKREQIDFERKTRWRYSADGKDFGPYTAEAMRNQIRGARVDGDTQVFEEWRQQWLRLGDIPQFGSALDEARRASEQAALHEATEVATKAVKSSARRRWWGANLGALVLIASGAGAATYFLYVPSGEPSNAERGLLRAVDVDPLLPWAPPLQDQAFPIPPDDRRAFAKVEKKVAKSSKRSGRSAGSGHALIDTDSPGDLPSGGSVDLDFTDEVITGSTDTTALSADEVSRVTASAGSRARTCVIAEAQRRPGFRGGKVIFALQPNGRVQNVRLVDAGKVTAELMGCLRTKLGTVKSQPFSGPPRTFELPIRVSTQ